MGRNCWSYHDQGKATVEGRCFNCGALDHKSESCQRPRGRQSGKGEESAPRGESGSNSATSTGAGGKGTGGGPKGSSSKGEGKQSQIRQVAPESSSAAISEAPTGSDPKVAKANETSSQELIAEATRLGESPERDEQGSVDSHDLVAPSASLVNDEPFYLTKVVKDPLKGARGLLDGGATNALRRARNQAELNNCTKTQVALALGQAELYLTPVGTLLSSEPVLPIVPMGVLVAELECRVSWEGETCVVIHPKRGRLPVVMINRCPELSARLTEELITEIEDRRARIMQRALQLRALGIAGCHVEPESSGCEEEMLEWLRKLSPDCPEGLLARVPPLWKEELGGKTFRSIVVCVGLCRGLTR